MPKPVHPAHTDLVAFLTARYNDTMLLATQAGNATHGVTWTYDPRKEWHLADEWLALARAGYRVNGGQEFVSVRYPDRDPIPVALTGPADDHDAATTARHIAHHDPIHVIAHIAAVREVVHMHTGPHACDTMGGACTTLRTLAFPYQTHPGFKWAWQTDDPLPRIPGAVTTSDTPASADT